MSYYKDRNFIKNGNFAIEGEGGMYPFLHWACDWDLDKDDKGEDYIVYAASEFYDEELQDNCCKISIIKQRVYSYPGPVQIPGIQQAFELNKSTKSSVLQLEFYAKRISGAEYATAVLYTYDNGYIYEKKAIKITDPSHEGVDSWVKCYCEFDLSGDFVLGGDGEYTLAIKGAQVDGDVPYAPQEFLLSDVKATVTNCISPYINVVQGNFDSYGNFETYWNKATSGGDTSYSIEVDNGKVYMSSQRDYVGARQSLFIPSFISLSEYASADLVIDVSVAEHSLFTANLYGFYPDGSSSDICSTGLGHTGPYNNKILGLPPVEAIQTTTVDYPNNPNMALSWFNRLVIEMFAKERIFDQTVRFGATIKDIQVNLFDPSVPIPENTGDFSNPYTDEHGRILRYREDYTDKGEFRFYEGSLPSKRSFILIDDKYYLADSNGMCKEGIYKFDEKLYYVFPDGRVACNEKFIYEGKVYQADRKCQYTYLCEKLSYINIKHKGEIINSKLMGLPVGAIRLELEFPEQYEAVTLSAKTTKSDRVIKNISIASGTKSNVVNLITERGQDMITFSYINVDGSKTEACFFLDIVDSGEEYVQETSLEILSDVHYVSINSSLGISYIIRPNLAIEVDVEWQSSDESVAIVDVFGNVLPIGIGTCTITAINNAANISDTCTLHVVSKIDSPFSISLSPTEANIGVSDSVFVRATVFNKNDATTNTSQEVTWESAKPSVATVKNGYITGVGEGTTNIYCYSRVDKNIKSTVVVNVSGESTSIKEIELNMYETMLDYDNPTRYEYLEWTPIPLNTNQTEVILTSSDPDTVKVALNGRLSIGSKPQLNVPIIIKCTSVSNPEIYRECIVTVVDKGYLPTITIKEKSVRTYVGKTIHVEYNISKGYELQDAVVKETSSGAYSDNIATIFGSYVRVNAIEEGEFTLTLSYSSDDGVVKKTCEIIIYKADDEPQYKEYLELLHSFQDGSYILRYFAIDSDDDLNITHYINIDNEDYYSSAKPELLLYNGDEYHYVFGYGLKPGLHTIKIKVVDSQGLENISDEVSLIVSDKNDSNYRKEVLKEAKKSYDEIKNDLIECLNDIIEDGKMSINDKREFTTRYKMFNMGYENLLNILDFCVKYINSQIETSQFEMATLSNSLSGDSGVAVATYSEGDYTNSNFETVTDMDYFQNECIKKLAARIFELEARLNELANNNNN